ncbi:hypothetical protein SBOR_5196 [Sclerotinia borealis F-4128]|uniref:Phytanoyl-CoA dioxygenase n=1 Tax=Sclerotinia borealis (strain F-4128) TaxID=1432307 RepID=W9CEU5_SCLBF|nr:hypothetical protein SBOR_5196 [Sclerotinia borealis F-4128]
METNYIISRQQHLFFEEHGYLVITNGFTREEIEKHKIWAKVVRDLPQTHEPCGYLQYQEINNKGERVLCRVENFAEEVFGFNSLLRGMKLVGIVSQLANTHMVLFKDKLNYKSAGAGGFAAHVDRVGYGAFSNLKHLSIAIAIDPAHTGNGGIEVVPGSHKMDVPIGADNTLEKSWVEAQQWVPVDLKSGKSDLLIQSAKHRNNGVQKGDMLIFGTSFAHRSGPNLSTHDRRVIYATYNRAIDGDNHDAYYLERAKRYPSSHHRIPGVDYRDGSASYAYGTPMLTIENLESNATAGKNDNDNGSSN